MFDKLSLMQRLDKIKTPFSITRLPNSQYAQIVFPRLTQFYDGISQTEYEFWVKASKIFPNRINIKITPSVHKIEPEIDSVEYQFLLLDYLLNHSNLVANPDDMQFNLEVFTKPHGNKIYVYQN